MRIPEASHCIPWNVVLVYDFETIFLCTRFFAKLAHTNQLGKSDESINKVWQKFETIDVISRLFNYLQIKCFENEGFFL